MRRLRTYRHMFLSVALVLLSVSMALVTPATQAGPIATQAGLITAQAGLIAVQAGPIAVQATKPAPVPKAPNASTGGAAQLAYTSATLTAAINPHGQETAYYFQYGTTTAYGAQTATTAVGSGTLSVRVSQVISGLQIGGIYHFRVVAVSSAGTTVGQDRAFMTKSLPLKFEIPRTPRLSVFGTPLSLVGSLTGTGAAGHEVVLQANRFPFLGGFANIGAPQVTDASGRFVFRVSGLSQNTQLRVTTLDTRPIYSSVVSVHVAVRVTLHARATKRAGYVHFYGTVTPATLGAPVSFQLLRAGRGPSIISGTTVAKGTSKVARFSSVVFIPHGHGGLYRAFVKTTNGSYASGYSRGVLVRSAPATVRVHRVRR